MIVGVTGLAGSGKDTVARMLLELVPGAVRIAFAEPLKRFCSEVYDWPLDKLEDQTFKATPDRRYVRLSRECIAELGWDDFIDEWHEGQYPGRDLHEVLGLSDEEYAGWAETGEVHLTPRHALQQLGTNWGRGCYSATWVDLAARRAAALRRAGCPLVVISDVRFNNEVAAVDRVLEVVRPGVARGAHASEAGISPEFVWVQIQNDGSLDALRAHVAGILAGLTP